MAGLRQAQRYTNSYKFGMNKTQTSAVREMFWLWTLVFNLTLPRWKLRQRFQKQNDLPNHDLRLTSSVLQQEMKFSFCMP